MLAALLTIGLGLGAGLILGRWLEHRGAVRAKGRLRRGLQLAALVVLNPVAFVGALWSLPALDPRLLLFPVVGLGTLVAAFLVGGITARLLHLDPQRALLFRTGLSYTNIGNLGGLAVFQLLGEAAYALVPLYKLFEELWYYGFLFPHTNPGKASDSVRAGLWKVLRDPFVLLVLGALGVGFLLNLSPWERPGWYGPLNALLIPLSTGLLLVAVGMDLKLSLSKVDTRPAFVLVALKLTLLPLVSVVLSGLMGFWSLSVVWKTALVLSCMPMAFLSMVPPALYGLDGKFTTTAWALSMVSLAITLPLLLLIAKL
ncbi:MAG: hypothetical protein WCG80_08975 [Spirochaetales bacterium]